MQVLKFEINAAGETVNKEQTFGAIKSHEQDICLPAGYRNWFWSGLSPVGQERKKTEDLRDDQKRSERYISIVENHQVILQMKQS